MSDNLAQFIIFFPIFLFSLSFHECAHAWMANRLGDPTAKMMGRLTLNPWPHIDIIGTVLFPLMMFLLPGLLLFGWAKPVPVDPRNLKGGRKGNLKVAAAGPLSNFLLAILLALILRGIASINPTGESWMIVVKMIQTGVILNLVLGVFNLIPFPPLDGGGVLEGILPQRYLGLFDQVSRYSFIILILALYSGILRYLSIPVYWMAGWLLP